MSNREKILIEFEDTYDRSDQIESIWAVNKGDYLYELDNIPFLAKGFALHDVVSTEESNDDIYVKELVEPSGHSTVRILFGKKSYIADTMKQLETMGCAWEGSHIPKLIAVDIPPNIPYSPIREFLRQGRDLGKWEYQEACLGQES